MTTKTDFVELVLTCGSWQEAQRIADDLLKKYLVGQIEFVEVEAQQWRDSGIAGAKEIRLIMETMGHKLESIEQAVSTMLGHDSAVFQKTSLHHPSPKAKELLEQATTV